MARAKEKAATEYRGAGAKAAAAEVERHAGRLGTPPDRLKYSIVFAKNAGLLEGGKSVVVRGRMPPALVKLAKAKTGISSDTELLTAALANLVAADDYADWLIAHRGSIAADLDLEV